MWAIYIPKHDFRKGCGIPGELDYMGSRDTEHKAQELCKQVTQAIGMRWKRFNTTEVPNALVPAMREEPPNKSNYNHGGMYVQTQ